MEAKRDLERYAADINYFDRRRKQLAKQYPDQWVAVYKQRVVGSAKDLQSLLTTLAGAGIPQGRAFIEYASEKEDLLIL